METTNGLGSRERIEYCKAAINNSRMAYALAYETAKACDRANAGELFDDIYESGYKTDGRTVFRAVVADGNGPAFRNLFKCVCDAFGWLHPTRSEVEEAFAEVVTDFEVPDLLGDRDPLAPIGCRVERIYGGRDDWTLTVPNCKGERMTVSLTGCEHSRSNRHDLMNRWVKGGRVAKFMPSHIVAACYVTDRLGNQWDRYNPTQKAGGAGRVINFEWMLEDTPDNRAAIIKEAARRFYACEVC